MKLTRWIIAGILLLLPIAGRLLWYYQGAFQRETPVATPDFANLTIPEPKLSTPMPPSQPVIGGDAPLVVFDFAHGNSLYLSEMDPLINSLRASGAEVVIDDGYSTYLSDLLKSADAYMVFLPTSDFDAYSTQEIERFVARGGRLLVAVDPTRLYGYSSYNTSTEIANLLLAPYGLAFNADYVYNLVENEANFRHVIAEDFTQSPLTDGLKQVVFYSAQSIHQSPLALIRGDENTLSSLDDKGGALALAASSQDGRVVAIGDITFLTTPYLQVADNQILLRNLVTFLTGGSSERVHDLQDYPYLFQHDIVVIAGEEFELNQDKASMFSDLQSKMLGQGLEVRFGEMAVPGQDAIYLSSLPPENAEIAALVDSLGITYAVDGGELEAIPMEATPTPYEDYGWGESAADTIYKVQVPGAGKFSSAEFGLLIYQPGAIQNQLFILGGNEDAILELARRLIGDGLYGCITLQNIAVCPVTPVESSDGLDDWDYTDDYYDYPIETPTPTPVG